MNISEMINIYGENIKYYRKKQKISLRELSEKTKININYLEQIENGEGGMVSSEYSVLISKALNLPPNFLCNTFDKS